MPFPLAGNATQSTSDPSDTPYLAALRQSMGWHDLRARAQALRAQAREARSTAGRLQRFKDAFATNFRGALFLLQADLEQAPGDQTLIEFGLHQVRALLQNKQPENALQLSAMLLRWGAPSPAMAELAQLRSFATLFKALEQHDLPMIAQQVEAVGPASASPDQALLRQQASVQLRQLYDSARVAKDKDTANKLGELYGRLSLDGTGIQLVSQIDNYIAQRDKVERSISLARQASERLSAELKRAEAKQLEYERSAAQLKDQIKQDNERKARLRDSQQRLRDETDGLEREQKRLQKEIEHLKGEQHLHLGRVPWRRVWPYLALCLLVPFLLGAVFGLRLASVRAANPVAAVINAPGPVATAQVGIAPAATGEPAQGAGPSPNANGPTTSSVTTDAPRPLVPPGLEPDRQEISGWVYSVSQSDPAIALDAINGAPASNGQFVVVTIRVANQTGKDQPLPQRFFWLSSEAGANYPSSRDLRLTAPGENTPARDLAEADELPADGQSHRVQLVFDLPRDTQRLFLRQRGSSHGWALAPIVLASANPAPVPDDYFGTTAGWNYDGPNADGNAVAWLPSSPAQLGKRQVAILVNVSRLAPPAQPIPLTLLVLKDARQRVYLMQSEAARAYKDRGEGLAAPIQATLRASGEAVPDNVQTYQVLLVFTVDADASGLMLFSPGTLDKGWSIAGPPAG